MKHLLACLRGLSLIYGSAFASATHVAQWSVHEIALVASRDYGNPCTEVG